MNKPDVLRFTSTLSTYDNKAVLRLPKPVAKVVEGMETVEGIVNTQRFRAKVLVVGGEERAIAVNAAMQRGSGAELGNSVEVAILGPEPYPEPPKDLWQDLSQSPEAVESWDGLTTLGKHDWIRWIEDTKNPGTRAKRIARTVEQLSNGKRRACCVNVYGFMECRINEDAVTQQ